jgi:hypothetical protein
LHRIDRRPSMARPPTNCPFSPSPSFSLWPYKAQASLSFPPFRIHLPVSAPEHPTHSAPPPCFRRRHWKSSSLVKNLPSSSFISLWCFYRRSLSLPSHRFSSPAPLGVAPRPHRSPARPAAIAKLLHRRLPFALELACLSFAR